MNVAAGLAVRVPGQPVIRCRQQFAGTTAAAAVAEQSSPGRKPRERERREGARDDEQVGGTTAEEHTTATERATGGGAGGGGDQREQGAKRPSPPASWTTRERNDGRHATTRASAGDQTRVGRWTTFGQSVGVSHSTAREPTRCCDAVAAQHQCGRPSRASAFGRVPRASEASEWVRR